MKSKILLLRPNHTQDKKDNYPTFPLGLGYIAAVLLEKGHKVDIIDLTLEDVDYTDLTNRIKKINSSVIGISALSYEYSQVKKLSAYLKEIIPCEIILGGPLPTYGHDLVLKKTNVDICILGEGELTIVDLLENLASLEKVKGIAYRDNGKIVLNAPRELISDLDTIPFPAYELLDVNKYSALLMRDIYMSYRNMPNKNKVHRKMALEASRGCPFACNFCSRLFKKIRKRRVDKVIEEIKYLKERYNIDIISFHDELFFLDKKLIYEFCQKIVSSKVGWYGMIRVDTADRATLEMFKKSNCLTIFFGVESGSERVLKNMNKGTTPLKIEQALRDVLEIGLPLDISLLLGYPGENKDSLQDTVDLLKRVGYPGIKFRYITPYPGSSLYDDCIKKGLIKNEEEYLESVGDGTGPYRPRINFTDFSDDELASLVPVLVKQVLRNYFIYLLKHPAYLLKYLFHKDFMNPVYYYYNRWFHPTNYDKAARKRKN